MSEIPVNVEPEGEGFETSCSCCDRPIHWGHGWLMSEGRSLAAFWFQWPEGHQGRFSLAVARFTHDEQLIPGVISISAEIRDGALRYGIDDINQGLWPDFFDSFGGLAGRDGGLRDKQLLFALVDAITENDRRLSSRILAVGLHS
jgi:hypothetical protein